MKRALHLLASSSGFGSTCGFLNCSISPLFFFLAIMLLFAVGAGAQSTANYTFSTNATGSLALDMNSNAIDMSTGTTQISASSVDQGVNASAISIGFDFWLNGNRYTQFNATTNGLVSLSSTGTSVLGSTYVVSGGTTTTPIISAFAADLGTGTSGKTHYKVVGTAPNRVLVIEFLNMTLYWTSSYTNDGTFQVRLYENTGVVEFVYGAMSITSSASGSDVTAGIGFATNTTTNNLIYVTSSSNTSSVTASFTDNPTYAAGAITNLNSASNGTRRVYSFTPPVPAAPTSLTFSGIGLTGMTLNWTASSPITNVLKYAVYNSSDGGTTFNFVNTVNVGTNTLAVTGLTPATSYQWRVYAVSEGGYSTALTGTQATNNPVPIMGNKTVGGAGSPDYATLAAAFADINANGLSGPINLILQSGYSSASETFPLVPPTSSVTSATNTVTVYPAVTGLSITSSSTTGTFNLNGSDNFILDGRVNATGTTKDLIVENTSTTGYTIQYINDATGNTVKYCVLRGVVTTTTSGVLLFSTTTGTTGNDNNTVDNCDIRDGATTPTNGVYSLGTTTTTATNNSNVTISNCNIFNFYNSTSTTTGGAGISISSGTTDWTISNNSFYQTATRSTFGAASTVNAILISNSTSGNNFAITGNYIGGSQALCGGTAWTINAATTVIFRAMQFTVGTTTPTSIQGNTIQNISVTTTSTSTAQSAISLVTGSFNCGNVTGNTIGSQSTTGSITFSTTATSVIFTAILAGTGTPGAINISNNTVGGITITTSASGTVSGRGIGVQGAATSCTISGNTIGSTTTASSFANATNSSLIGIFCSVTTTSPATTVTNNTVANLTVTSTGTAATLTGMLIQGSTGGLFSTTGNTVRNLSSAATNIGTSGSAAVIGISHTAATTAGQTLSQNTVYNISSTAASAAVSITGIYESGPTTGTNVFNRNVVYGMSVTSTAGIINGMQCNGGAITYSNNMIRLGNDAAGASLTTAAAINGINQTLGTDNFYHNSVYIGGTGVGTTASNTFALNSTQTVNTRNFINNIFVNARSNATTGGKHYGVRYGGTTVNPTGLTASNNIFYVSGTGGVFGLFNGADVATIAAWRAATGQDLNSGSGDPNFTNATGSITAGTYPLKVSGTTPAEGAGSASTGITDDVEGDTRSGLTPVDIGADAGNYTSSDIFPPIVTYTALTNRTASNTSVASFATIADNVGVSTGANLPRLYYKKSTDANAFVGNTSADNGWKYVVASNSSSPFSFTLDYSIINGGSVATGNIIQYFVVAQDDANNLGSRNPGATASANPSVQNVNAAPTTLDQFTIVASFSGSINVGTGQTYTSLTNTGGLFEAINAGLLTGNVTANITSDLSAELGTNSLNQWLEFPTSSNFTLTIQPSGGAARTIIGAVAGPLINLNGADRVTIDGLNTGGNSLTIRNTNAGTSASTIRFIADATNNTVQNCTIEGATTNTTGGTIFFSTGTTTGNDNNTIANNNIRDRSDVAGLPLNAIYASGTASPADNSNVTISGNNIYNYFNAATASNGIVVSSGNTDWTISNNKFYQEASRTFTTGVLHTAITVSNSSGNNFSISGNTIGYASSSATGVYTLTGVTNSFRAINLSVGTTTASNVQGNTIAGISHTTTTSGTSSSSPCMMIYVSSGVVNIGNVTGNTIGSQSATGSIVFSSSATTASDVNAIFNFSTNNAIISNNLIGGMTAANSSTGASNLYGIRVNTGSTVTLTVQNNTVGGTVANSMQSTSTSASSIVNGILNVAPASTITGNTVRNLTAAGGTGTGTSASVAGIIVAASSANHTVSQNTVHSLSNTNAASAVVVTGIYFGSSTGTNLVSRNFVHSFSISSTSSTSAMNGILMAGGTATFQNNMIRLGLDAAGNSVNTGMAINGIIESSGTNNFYHNSVYIGGAPTTGTGNSFAFSSSVTTNTRNFQNNIFANARSNSGSTGKHYAISVGGTGVNPTGLTLNYNIYQASGTGGVLGLYSAADVTSIGAWRSATGQDANTGVGSPNFVAPTGTSSTVDLHVQGTTPAEASGTNIASVTDDYDGETRSGLTPVDIGADAGNYTAQDIIAPIISYTTFSFALPTNVVLNNFATITDNLAVSTGANLPRLYFKKSTDANAFVGNTSADNGWKYVVASNSTSPFSFTIDFSIINGGSVTPGDIIQYFVVAQDDANNLGSRPFSASASGNPPVQNINAAPTTPDQFTIAAGISGTVNVGTGQTYTSLTNGGGLFSAINAGVVTGNIIANITSDLTETGTVSLGQTSESPINSGFTITIQPSGGATRTISGTVNNPMIIMNGADRVTFDGLNTGGNAMTISNLSTGSTASTIQFINDATNNTIQNCTIEGATTSTTGGVIFISTGAVTGNDNLTITNNSIKEAASNSPVNAIYALGSASFTNSSNTITNNAIYNWSTNGVNITSTGNGNTWNISNNSFYQTASRTATLTAIALNSGGNGNTVNNNSIGGGNSSRGGTAMTTSTAVSCITLSVGTTTATEVQGNNIGNIVTTSTSSTGYGIGVIAGNVNIGTTSGNTIGGATANDISVANSFDGINVTSTGTVDIRNNTVRNLKFEDADFERLSGINVTSGTVTIKDNTIRDFLHKGTTTSTLTSSFAYFGIRLANSTSGNLVEGNSIFNLVLDFNGANGVNTYPAGGIFVTGAITNSTVTRNRIYNITTTRTGTTTSAPTIMGIYANAGSVTYSNNQISLSQSTASTQPLFRGIQLESTSANNFYYNSIYVGGTAAAANNTYGFYRNTTTGTQTLRNNVLYNERSGTGSHYAIGTASTTGWVSSVSSDYSLFIGANAANIGDWGGTANNFATWKTNTTGDTYSWSDLNTNAASANLFSATSSGNLNINTANIEAWYVAGKGVQITGQTADYGDVAANRSVLVSTGATDIGSDEIGTPTPAPHTATQTGTIAVGNTTTYSFAGRTLASITWQSGTVPASLALKYYSGENPPNPTCGNPAAKYANAYWDITPNVTSGYTFNLSVGYTPAILGTIAAETDSRLAENENNTCWITYSNSTVNTTTKFVTQTGLTSFSVWTLTDLNAPLPVELTTFKASAVGPVNQLDWATAAEIDLNRFVVERSSDGINFQPIGQEQAKGSSSTYRFDDAKPYSVSYYRLRMEDNGGKFEHSKTLVVARAIGTFSIQAIYPSPTSDRANVAFEAPEEGAMTLLVTDMTGRVALRLDIDAAKGLNTNELDLSELPAGIYQVNGIFNGTLSKPFRVVKQ